MTDHATRGRRNKRKGQTKQAAARRALEAAFGINPPVLHDRTHEERWTHLPIRIEVKAGAQVAPVAIRYSAASRQSDEARNTEDTRPFAYVAMPDGTSDGLIVMRLSDFASIARYVPLVD
jgi:hypothetical protein